MSFPLWYILVPFAAIVLFSGLFLLFNLFDMGKYGVASGSTRFILYLYIAGFLVILALSIMSFTAIDWNAELNPSSLIPGFGANSNTYGL